MITLLEAAQQALKSLRGYRREISCEQSCDAERALEAALEQPEPEQEPVAWMRPDNRVAEESTARIQFSRGAVKPPIGTWVPLYTHPPRREWRGLDKDETMHLMNDTAENYWADEAHIQRFSRAIEAALRSKNHE